jgi:epoxyqueuosine reductase QueG
VGDLAEKAAEFLLTGGDNLVETVEPISTAPTSTEPLPIFDRPLFGVADVTDPLWDVLKAPAVVGPRHLSPGDWLPGARSVISYFLPFTRRVRLANRIRQVTATEWLYGRYEGQACNAALAAFIVGLVESAGGRALAPVMGERWSVVDLRSNWSERHIAFIAGLGTFGLSRSMITRKGSAGRFGSVITDLPLPPTPRPYRDIGEYCLNCGVCIKRCPCQAITESGKDNRMCKAYVDIERSKYQPRYGCGKCQTAVPCESRIPQRRD